MKVRGRTSIGSVVAIVFRRCGNEDCGGRGQDDELREMHDVDGSREGRKLLELISKCLWKVMSDERSNVSGRCDIY